MKIKSENARNRKMTALMSRFSKCLSVVAIILASFLILSLGCGKKEDGVIKIGVVTTLTGASAKYGISALNGIKMATEEMNAINGILGKRIELIVEDDASEASRAVSAFRKLVDVHNVPVIIGPISSSSAMACSPIANEQEVVLFSPSAATPDFSSPNDYTFRNRVSSKYEIEILAGAVFNNLRLKTVALLTVNNAYGKGNRDYFKSSFEASGGKVLIAETFDEGANDMRTQIAKIKSVSPEAVFVVGQGLEAGYVLRQAVELGINSRFFSTITIQREDVIEIAGEAAEGVVYTVPAFSPDMSDIARDFEDKYKGIYGVASDLFAANGYDAVKIIAEAIKRGGYSASSIKVQLFSIKNYPGVGGDTSFDKNGDVIKPTTLKTIINGQFISFEK